MLKDVLSLNQYKSFEEIVNTVTFRQFKNAYFMGILPILKNDMPHAGEHTEKLKRDLESVESYIKTLSETEKQQAKTTDTLANIAFFARAVKQMHPAFDQPDFDTIAFQQRIENLYHEQSLLKPEHQLKGRDLLNMFFQITATTLRDNHLSVVDENNKFPMDNFDMEIKKWGQTLLKHEEGQVGKNFVFTHSDDWQILASEQLSNNIDYLLLIAQKKQSGKITGIIALSTCRVDWGSEKQSDELIQWNKILSCFKENYAHWDHIIIDVRGNTGGDAFQLREIAETLYGNTVPYCMQARQRHSPEADLRLLGGGEIEDQPIWDKNAHPFRGNKKKLYILTDRATSSAAEAIVPMLKNYPGVRFIGEHTCGCCQFGGIRPVPLPCGGKLNIGSVLRTFEDGWVECVGHKPDIDCTGKEALSVALSQIKADHRCLKENHTR